MQFLAGLLISAFVWAAPNDSLISRTVGRVKDHIVTSREVQMNYLIENSLYPTKKKDQFKQLPSSGREFYRESTAVLLEWTIHLEAETFSAAKVKSSEITKAEQSVYKHAAQTPAWKSLEVKKQELQEALKRKLQSKKFIRFKVDSASVPVTDAEARAYFNANRVQFGDLPFENFKSNIKAFLSRKNVDQRLKDWFEVLQAKYNVRNFLAEL